VVSDDCTDLAEHRDGDPDAFGRLYDRHASVVLALCVRNATNRSHAEGEDALQETFTRAFRMLDRVEDCTGFRAWLYRIAGYVCSESRRSAKRRRSHEHGAAREAAQLRLAGSETEDTQERGEQLQRLDQAMEQLPEKERLVIHLQYLDPNPVGAAQRSLGLSRSGYYKTLQRARERLSALMSKEMTA
jgi:RNA polymerase sigma-70 factor (ECF subfamily)